MIGTFEYCINRYMFMFSHILYTRCFRNKRLHWSYSHWQNVRSYVLFFHVFFIGECVGNKMNKSLRHPKAFSFYEPLHTANTCARWGRYSQFILSLHLRQMTLPCLAVTFLPLVLGRSQSSSLFLKWRSIPRWSVALSSSGAFCLDDFLR